MARITLEENVSGRDLGKYFYHFNERDNIEVYVVRKKRSENKLIPEYVCTVDNSSDAQDICYSLNTSREKIKNPYNYISKKRRFFGKIHQRRDPNSSDNDY